MQDFFSHLFDTRGFPQRWHCGLWTAGHGWLHILSDVAICGAYVAIPAVILYYIWKRRDVPFPRIFWLFGAFIFSCGIGHLMEAAIFWWPAYRLDGMIKLTTAVVSWATVFVLIPIVPKALSLPGLATLNQQLQVEVQQRKTAEDQLRRFNQQLEETVALRVHELRRSEEYLDLAQQAASLGAFEVDTATRTLAGSEGLMLLCDRQAEPGRMTMDEWFSQVHPQDRVRAVRELELAIQHGGPYESEFRIVRPDGSIRYLLGQGQARSTAERTDGPHSLLGVFLDVSARKELEEAIATQIDQEKQRISQELHDGLGQKMTGLGYLAKSLHRSLSESESSWASQAGELSSAIPGIVRDVRMMVRGLMPVELDDSGLMSALEQLCQATSQRAALECCWECDGPVETHDPEVSQQLYRIAQESVNNAVKHAAARNITIRLAGNSEGVCLEIIDDGRGLPQDAQARGGLGLRILQHRAARIGGDLTIESENDHGTHIRCTWTRQLPDSLCSSQAVPGLDC